MSQQGRYEDAAALARVMLNQKAARAEGYVLQSRLDVATGRIGDARKALERAAEEFPRDAEVLRARSQFYFDHGGTDEAQAAMLALIAQIPTDASTHHNLGTLFLKAGRFDEAVRAYRQSLRFRSNSPATYLNLAAALKESGRLEEAVAAWEQVLRLTPGDMTAQRELIRAGARRCWQPVKVRVGQRRGRRNHSDRRPARRQGCKRRLH